MNLIQFERRICAKLNDLGERLADLEERRDDLIAVRAPIEREIAKYDTELYRLYGAGKEWQFLVDILTDLLADMEDEAYEANTEIGRIIDEIDDIEYAFEEAECALDV